MLEEKKSPSRETPHNLMLENRSKLCITGVTDVDTFDESKIVLFTEEETMQIEGYDLHINKLNVADGELVIDGEIVSIVYTGRDAKNKKGLFGRMFQ